MRKLTKVLGLLLTLAALAAFPVVCLAQAAGVDAPTAAGFPFAVVIAIGAAAVGVLGAILNFLPAGTRTYVNAAIGIVVAIGATLTDLQQTHPTASMMAVALACIGAIIGRTKAAKT